MDRKWKKLEKKSEGTRDKQKVVCQQAAWDCNPTSDQQLFYATNLTRPGV